MVELSSAVTLTVMVLLPSSGQTRLRGAPEATAVPLTVTVALDSTAAAVTCVLFAAKPTDAVYSVTDELNAGSKLISVIDSDESDASLSGGRARGTGVSPLLPHEAISDAMKSKTSRPPGA